MKIRERTKQMMVIGLAVLFLLVGYYRFLHGKIAFFGRSESGVALTAVIEVPAVDLGDSSPAAEPKRMELEGTRGRFRDIFAPPKPPKAAILPAAVAVAAAAAPPKPLPALKLSGTVAGGKRPLAVINGRFLRNGEVIDGYEVVSISRDRVTLQGEGRKVVLNPLTGAEELSR